MYGVLFSTAGFAGARAGGFELGRNGKGKTGMTLQKYVRARIERFPFWRKKSWDT